MSTATSNLLSQDTCAASTRPEELSADEVGSILEDCGAGRIERVVSLSRQDRLYSTVWSATVVHSAGSASYLLKRARGPADKAIWLSQRADRLLASNALHAPLELRRHDPTGFIVSRRFDGASLADLLAATAPRNPLSRRSKLETAVALAGQWLAAYHAQDRRKGSIIEPLRTYVAGWQVEFEALPTSIRSAFERLLAEDIVDDLVTTHGDFTPGNILTDGEKVCAIDFGVREWMEMSPWWDVVTLDIVLERFFRCDKAITGFWLKPAFPRLRAAFFEAYGASPDENSSARAICTAARHLPLAGLARPRLFGGDARYRWHLRQLADALSRV